jgi:hypothetical protein
LIPGQALRPTPLYIQSFDKRAIIAGEIVTLEGKLRYARDALTNLDAAIGLTNPDARLQAR